MFRLYIAGFILLLIAGLSASTYVMYLRMHAANLEAASAQEHLSQAVAVNKANAKAVRELELDRQIEKAATEKELAAAQQRATAIDSAKKELQNVPGASEKAPSYFDAVDDRLHKPAGS